MSRKIVKTKLPVTIELDGKDIPLTLLLVSKKAQKQFKKARDKKSEPLDDAVKIARKIKMLVEDGQAINLRLTIEEDKKKRVLLINKHDKVRADLKALYPKQDELDDTEIDFDAMEKDEVLAGIEKTDHKKAIEIADLIGWKSLGLIVQELWIEDKQKK